MESRAQDWELVERLFAEATDVPAPSRRAFLDSACAGDPELRHEVESLLAADTAAGDAITTAVGGAAEALVGIRDLAGSFVGPYRIVREIGRGGMGTVYLAVRDDEAYSRQVAVKLIRHGMDTEDVLGRFRHERRILANLDHPYIARLLDGGTTTDGRPYFVMEYVTGETLDVWSRERPFGADTIRPRLELFLKICEAVSHAHRKLVVHRDLKPANIFIAADGSPKLLDFGVAKLLEPDIAFRTTATIAAGRPLTPDFASPEQVRGGEITTSTDVYSLGAILYELLSGVRAHRFNSYGMTEMERVVCEVDPVAMADAVPDARNHLRGDLQAIVSMAMRKEPDRRYQSVDQLAADVKDYLHGRAVAARQGDFAYRAGKYLRRHRTAIAVSLLFAVALIGGATVATLQAIRANHEQGLAEEARVLADANRLRAEASRRNAELQAAEAERERTEAERERTEAERQRTEAEAQRREALLQRSFAETERQLASRRFDQVRQLAGKFVIDFHNSIASLPGSTPARKMVVETGLEYYNLLVKDAGGDRGLLEEIARGYDSLGDVQGNPYYANLGDVAGALASYRRALSIRDAIVDPSPEFQRDRIRADVRLSQILTAQGDMKAADTAGREAVSIGENSVAVVTGPGRYDLRAALANAYSTYGDLKLRIGANQEALDPYLKLLAVAERQAQEHLHPEQEQAGLSLAHTKLGDVYYRLARQREAMDQLKSAQVIDKAVAAAHPQNGPARRKLFITTTLLGRVLHSTGGVGLATPAEVTEQLQAARDLAVQMSAADPENVTALFDLAMSETGLGDWLLEQKEAVKALEAFTRAVAAASRVSGMQTTGADDLFIQVHHRMATGLVAVGRYDEALEQVRLGEGFASAAEKLTPGTSRNAARLAELTRIRADVYTARKQWDEATSAWRQLIASTKTLAKDRPVVLDEEPALHAGLALCYSAEGHNDLAEAELREELTEFTAIAARRPLSAEEQSQREGAQKKLAALNPAGRN